MMHMASGKVQIPAPSPTKELDAHPIAGVQGSIRSERGVLRQALLQDKNVTAPPLVH